MCNCELLLQQLLISFVKFSSLIFILQDEYNYDDEEFEDYEDDFEEEDLEEVKVRNKYFYTVIFVNLSILIPSAYYHHHEILIRVILFGGGIASFSRNFEYVPPLLTDTCNINSFIGIFVVVPL